MGKLKDSFTAVATSLTPESRRNEAQKFTALLRHIEFEADFFSRAKNWLRGDEAKDLSKDIYFETLKDKLAQTGFDMTQWGFLRNFAEQSRAFSASGAMQRTLEDDTAASELKRLAGSRKDIATAVAAADDELKPLRDKIVNEQQAAYFMYRPMM